MSSEVTNDSNVETEMFRLMTRPVRKSRADYLRLICRLLKCRGLALLWLYDSEKKHFALNHISSSKGPFDLDEADSQLVRWLPSPPDLADILNTEKICSGKQVRDSLQPYMLEKTHGALRLLVKKTGMPVGPDINLDTLILPIWERGIQTNASNSEAHSTRLERHRLTGFVQVVGAFETNAPLLRLLCNIISNLADHIDRHRRRRLRSANEQLRKKYKLEEDVDKAFQEAVNVIALHTDAEVCLICRQDTKPGLYAVCAYPQTVSVQDIKPQVDSLIHEVAMRKKSVRLADFGDANEVQENFDRIHDCTDTVLKHINEFLTTDKMKSWIAKPILIGDGDEKHTFAVIMLANKKRDLAHVFGEADDELVQQVSNYFSRILPSIESLKAMKAISEGIEGGDLSDPAYRQRLFALLQQSVYGVKCAAIIKQDNDKADIKVIRLSDDDCWFQPEPRLLNSTTNVEALSDRKNHHYVYIRRIDSIEKPKASLAIGLWRDGLSPFHKQAIDFLCTQLGQMIGAQFRYEQEVKFFLETRHAVRAYLTGTVGNAKIAATSLKLIRRKGAKIQDYHASQLGKAIRRTYEFAYRTYALLEAVKFRLSEVKKDSLRIGSVRTPHLIGDVTMMLREEAKRRDVEITYSNSIPMDRDLLVGDRQLWEIAIFNLVDNAVKYSFRKQKVEITTHIVKSKWHLSVIDYGEYIPEDRREDIFRPYERIATGYQDTTRPGTGLGLAVVKQIVEAHDSTIHVTSEYDDFDKKGPARTCFRIEAPRR